MKIVNYDVCNANDKYVLIDLPFEDIRDAFTINELEWIENGVHRKHFDKINLYVYWPPNY